MRYGDLLKRLANEGGFSVSARTGKPPASGVMVSRSGSEQVFDGIPTERDLDAFVKQHARALSSPRAYFGAWVDEGRTYLDVSDRFDGHGSDARPTRERRGDVDPEADSDRALAANRQLAGYHVDSGQVYSTPPQLFDPGDDPNVPPHRRVRRHREDLLSEARNRAEMRRTQTRLFDP